MGHSRPFICEALRQCIGEPFHLRHGLASRLARGSVPGNGHRRIAVIALELLRARCPFNLRKRAEGHHFAGCISNLEVEHVLWRHSVRCFGLQEHPQDPPFTVEVIGICAAESDRGQRILDRDDLVILRPNVFRKESLGMVEFAGLGVITDGNSRLYLPPTGTSRVCSARASWTPFPAFAAASSAFLWAKVGCSESKA